MRVVISLTTIPNRIFYVKKVLYSILHQSAHFDALYFNIPNVCKKNNKKYKIPLYLKIIDDKRFILNRCEDYGPITKLIPTLEKETNPDTIIIVCDDDQIWGKNTLTYFLQKQKEYPNEALSLSGFCIGKFPFYFQVINDSNSDTLVDWIQGTTGILIKREMLNIEKLKDYSQFPKSKQILQRNDDHWINFQLHQNNVNRRKIAGDCKKYFFEQEIRNINAISSRLGIFQFEVLYVCYILKCYHRKLPLTLENAKYGIVFFLMLCITFVFCTRKAITNCLKLNQ